MLYNHRELRRELEAAGEKFASGSDSEVLLALYARLGPACLQRLRGMFAFAIWHGREEKLFLARDRIGEKPLMYYHDGPVLAFASEIPALLRLDWVPRRVDPAGLHLGLYYVQAPAPWTAFRDIRRLAPGAWLELSRKGLRTEQHWSCRFDRLERFHDLASAAEGVRSCLDETTALMCRSNVPIGATLSGGLDSGAVVSSMSRTMRGFPTFRVSHGPAANPAEYRSSEKIARQYGTQHHQFLAGSSVVSIDDAVRTFGEPVAMPIPAQAQEMARQAKPFATVVLTGTGGDELFAGYPDHWVLRRLDRQRAGQAKPNRARLREDLVALSAADVLGCLKFSPMRPVAARVYGPKMQEAAAQHDPAELCAKVFAASGATNLMDGFLAQELLLLNQYSLTSLLSADGLRHGVEFRSPFLDSKMIEMAMRIPARFKVGLAGQTLRRKLALREAMRDRLPRETLCAQDKTGSTANNPSAHSLEREPGNALHQRLASPALSDLGLFDTRAIEEVWLLSAMNAGVPVDWLWGIALISAWLECYF